MKALAVAALVALLAGACAKKEDKTNQEPISAGTTITSKRAVAVEHSNIQLPAGTRVALDEKGYVLSIALPEGYAFLTRSTGLPGAAARLAGGGASATYTCTCSGEGACKVFYQEEAGGFGCLHNTCSASCTGSFTAKDGQPVVGVLNTANEVLTARMDQPFASAALEPEGYTVFFADPAVQKAVAEQYNLLYRQVKKPDFDLLESRPDLKKNYVYLRVQLYGVFFYLLAPPDVAALPGSDTYSSAASCDCKAPTGTCTQRGGGFLGFRVYWCEGTCNGCALTVGNSAPQPHLL